MKNNNFYTFRGYNIKNIKDLSASMEDYIEMIYRLSCEKDVVRVNDLSESLNVQPPSTTKMIKKLSKLEFVDYERYGHVHLTDKGLEMGKYLLYRHKIINDFLELIGVEDNLLEQTEKIEHAVNESTVDKIRQIIIFLNNNFEIYEEHIKKNF